MKRLLTVLTPLAFSTSFALACGNNPDGHGGEVSEDDLVTESSETFCGLMFDECSCDPAPYADKDECLSSQAEILGDDQAAAQEAGLEYNGKCAGANIHEWEHIGCKGSSEIEHEDTCESCTVYHGDVAVGESCTSYGSASDCANGLFCSQGACVDPCEAFNNQLSEGDACEVEAPEAYCKAGLYCDVEGLICTALPAVGEACPGYQCEAGAVCDQAEGLCAAAPDVGEPCPNFGCAKGAYCDTTDPESPVCVEENAWICS